MHQAARPSRFSPPSLWPSLQTRSRVKTPKTHTFHYITRAHKAHCYPPRATVNLRAARIMIFDLTSCQISVLKYLEKLRKGCRLFLSVIHFSGTLRLFSRLESCYLTLFFPLLQSYKHTLVRKSEGGYFSF